MASANAARGLAVMFSLYLHRHLTSVILFRFFPKHESNAYSLVWQMGGIEIEDSSCCSNLLTGPFISVELIIMNGFFSVLGKEFWDSVQRASQCPGWCQNEKCVNEKAKIYISCCLNHV